MGCKAAIWDHLSFVCGCLNAAYTNADWYEYKVGANKTYSIAS